MRERGDASFASGGVRALIDTHTFRTIIATDISLPPSHMPGVEGFNTLEAQPVAPKGAVDTKDVLAEGIGEVTENKTMSVSTQIEG
jgi:hypothetical protein